MKARINIYEKGAVAMKAVYSLANYLEKSVVEQALLNLIYFRISQINGCAYCLDMHSKDLRAKGESEMRLYVLNAWREAPFYTEREKTALLWAEAVTQAQVPDHVYEEAQKQFSPEELIDLTMATITINNYNRINLAFPNPETVGTYRPGAYNG